MAAWNAFVWKGKYLRWTAANIAADNELAAKQRSVHALTCRPGHVADKDLLRLKAYLHGDAPEPEGLYIEVHQVADGPPRV